jgi:capsular exopolysaccharide synthesis family protein
VRSPHSSNKVQPKPMRNAVLGLFFGLLLGIALAFVRDATDTRVRTPDEISEMLNLPIVGRIPPPSKSLAPNELVMLSEPDGAQAEMFRLLRTNLQFASLSHPGRVIMMTSAREAEGKTTTVANLAVALARAGDNVALIDLDLRRPAVHRFFGLSPEPGITDVVVGTTDREEAGHQINVTGSTNGGGRSRHDQGGSLEVFTCGVLPPDPGEFVGAPALIETIGRLRADVDWLLIDAPPTLQVGDPLTLSAHVEAILAVARVNVVRRPMLREFARLLAASPAHKLGAIITGDESEAGRYGYYGHYGAYGVYGSEKSTVADPS